ncbi:MAG: HU family DNA-binding protein [Anaerolineaceae bacterium]|nr:HU family DNA-binding protein [Anaerolineaceae bacterium]
MVVIKERLNILSNNIDKKELVNRIAQRVPLPSSTIERVVDATIEEIYESLKQGEGVTLRNFGTFYIDSRRSGTVFKFNPAQRLRAIFGWSSTYKGDL